MTTTELKPTRAAASGGGMASAFRDTMVVAWRNLRGGWRVPDNQVYMFIQPIMFVLLFAYVFGGAIPVPGAEGDPLAYREFLMAGIFAQTMAFASAPASVGLADDMQKGLIDRFRSLPMARSGVIAGRVVADLANQVIVLVIMIICGLIVGWRFHNGVPQFLAGVGLLLLLAFSMLWVGALIGLSVGKPAGGRLGRPDLAVPGDVPVQCVRPAAYPAGLAPGGGGVEPDQLVRLGLPRAVRKSEPVRDRQLPEPESCPDVADLGRRHRWDLRATGDPQVQGRNHEVR